MSLEDLSYPYSICDIGLMVSLQEQHSYATIEMVMFGMPMIITAVDGLDEMFVDEVSSLKVNYNI